MEKKTRYCPSCGDKSNDAVCSICGKRTHSASLHKQELGLLADAVASDMEETKLNEERQAEPKQTHNEMLHMKRIELPNYMKIDHININWRYVKVFSILLLIFCLLGGVMVAIGMFTHNEATIKNEQMGAFSDYLKVKHDYEFIDLSFDIVYVNNQQMITLKNDSSSFVSGTLTDGEHFEHVIKLLQPYATYYYEKPDVVTNDIEFQMNDTFDYTYHIPKNTYHIYDRQNKVIIDVEEDLSDELIKNMMMYITSGYYLADNLSGKVFQMKLNEGKIIYDVNVESREGEITLYFNGTKGTNKAFLQTFDASE